MNYYDGVTLVNVTGVASVGQMLVMALRKTGNAKRFSVNGAQVGSINNAAMTPVTGNLATIGIYRGVAQNMSGSIGPILAIKGTLSDSELLTLERFVSALTPNGPAF